MSFGASIFDKTRKNLVYNRYLKNPQIIDSSFVYGYNVMVNKPSYLYNFRKDSLLQQNLLLNPAFEGQKRFLDSNLKAFLQQYDDAMIENQLFIGK